MRDVQQKNSELSNEAVGDKFTGLKNAESSIRAAYKALIPMELQPDKMTIGTEITEYDGNNAYALGYAEWEVLMPVDGTSDQSSLEVLAEEVAHNINRGMRQDTDLDRTDEAIYREFIANAMADSILEGRNEENVSHYRDINEEIEEFYDKERVAERIQADIPIIIDLIENEVGGTDNYNWDLELGPEYAERLRSNITAEDLVFDKVNEAAEVTIRRPTVDYEDHMIEKHTWNPPEEVISEMETDQELSPREFADKYDSLIVKMKAKARKRAGFDQAHTVGRELWHQLKSEGIDIEEIMQLSNRKVENIITSKAPEIIQEYGLDHEKFEPKKHFLKS